MKKEKDAFNHHISQHCITEFANVIRQEEIRSINRIRERKPSLFANVIVIMG